MSVFPCEIRVVMRTMTGIFVGLRELERPPGERKGLLAVIRLSTGTCALRRGSGVLLVREL
jgi:hypothetical protein